MIEIKKELTIKEIFAEMMILKSRLIKLSHKYNRSMILISAITYKDIITKGGRKSDDIMLDNIIKREDLKDEFDVVKESYDNYKDIAIEKIQAMISTKPVDYCIAYFRDELHWSWKDICKLFNYSRSQASKKYSDFKKRTTSDTVGH